MTYEGPVRRADLTLRGKFIEIKTTIYKINDSTYSIYVENFQGDFNHLKKEFAVIKVLTTPVDVVNEIPQTYEAIIPSITDKEIALNFEGMPVNLMDLLSILLTKFPNVYFKGVSEVNSNVVITTFKFKEKIGDTIYSRFLSLENRKKITEFIVNLKSNFGVEIIEEEVDAPPINQPQTIENPVSYILADTYKRKGRLEFVERDQTLWYDNIDKIFQGDFKKKDLYFYNPDEYSCYVDYSVFENIDLRNHLLLFQVVYLSLPIEKSVKDWLKPMEVTVDEFLELIRRNRIKIVLNQPEARYDQGVLNEIYKTSPNSIVSARALSALQQIDIVEISDNYLFNDEQSLKEIQILCEATSKVANIDARSMYEALVWPIKARRNSFNSVHASKSLVVPGYGIHNSIQDRISQVAKKDLSLECIIASSSIHLSNALNATYFPFKDSSGFSDYYYANVMGTMLNFYKNATSDRLASFIDSREEINSGVLPINPIECIKVGNLDNILQVEAQLSKEIIYPGSKRLIEHLASLSPEERKKTIDSYNAAINGKRKWSLKNHDKIDIGHNFLMDVAGKLTGLDYLGTAFTGIKIGGKKIGKLFPELKHIGAKIEESIYNKNVDKANIHYLSKINRVARVYNK